MSSCGKWVSRHVRTRWRIDGHVIAANTELSRLGAYLFFSLPLGMTEVVGAMGRVEADPGSLGALASFFGFFVILLLRCSPLAMACSF